MSSNSVVVVVWEVESTADDNKYVAYSPSVSQHLERAYAKYLTQVRLGDSDINLSEFYVNLRTMKQCTENSSPDQPELNVRRQFYSPSSPLGKGIKWEFAGNSMNQWIRYDIDVQCIIEDAWANGCNKIDLSTSYSHLPYVIDFCSMIQIRKPSGPINPIRRTTQPLYPLTKLQNYAMTQPKPPPIMLPASASAKMSLNSARFNTTTASQRRLQMQQQQLQHKQLSASTPKLSNSMEILSSKKEFRKPPPVPSSYSQSSINCAATSSNNNASASSKSLTLPPNSSSTAASSTVGKKSTKKSSAESNISRLLNNLNIFSHHHHHHQSHHQNNSQHHQQLPSHHDKFAETRSMSGSMKVSNNDSAKLQRRSFFRSSQGSASMTDLDASSFNSRRPSVDTISTYLSNGSNKVHPIDERSYQRSKFSYESVPDLLNLSSESDDVFLPFTNVARLSRRSRQSIKGSIVGIDSNSEHLSRFVSVVEAHEIQKLQTCPICLNELLRDNSVQNPSVALSRCKHIMHLSCLNELILNQRTGIQKCLYIECPLCSSIYGEKYGNQPPGTMSWCTISKSLPGYENCTTIQIIYNISSGIQNEYHSNPGKEFFAVGFPRSCYIPDNPTGRKILKYLKTSFDRGLLFDIGRSATTGHEDVVIWSNVEQKSQFSMYPDPTYMQRVLEQLIHLGVTD